jgi:profilin
MSWDSYIDNLVSQTKDSNGVAHSDKACIIGLDGGAPWTTNGHAMALPLQGNEAQTIASAFKSKDFSTFMTQGLHIGGVKYQFLRGDEGKMVLAKKKDHGAITAQSSKTAIVIAHCPEGGQQGNTNKGVAVIAEYLESLGM